MNCYKNLLRYFKTAFLLFILQLITTNILAQSNSITFSPLNLIVSNTDFGYERMIKNNVSLEGNLQVWFQDDEEHSTFVGRHYSHTVNKGLRGSIVLRQYLFKRENKKAKNIKGSIFNCGFSIHYGKNYVKKIDSFIPISFNLSGIWGGNTISSKPSHDYTPTYDTTILSGGIGCHFAFKLLLKDGFFMNFELVARNSWANKEGNSFPEIIKGWSNQPKFQLGYSF